jgi:hypothetical protein
VLARNKAVDSLDFVVEADPVAQNRAFAEEPVEAVATAAVEKPVVAADNQVVAVAFAMVAVPAAVEAFVLAFHTRRIVHTHSF